MRINVTMMNHEHPASVARSLASFAGLLLMLFTLSACETTGFSSMSGLSGEARAERLATDGRHADAASEY
ncbi:MAG: hypothetical protein WBN61_03865, partial [Woeseiaceae bacterium]